MPAHHCKVHHAIIRRTHQWENKSSMQSAHPRENAWRTCFASKFGNQAGARKQNRPGRPSPLENTRRTLIRTHRCRAGRSQVVANKFPFCSKPRARQEPATTSRDRAQIFGPISISGACPEIKRRWHIARTARWLRIRSKYSHVAVKTGLHHAIRCDPTHIQPEPPAQSGFDSSAQDRPRRSSICASPQDAAPATPENNPSTTSPDRARG